MLATINITDIVLITPCLSIQLAISPGIKYPINTMSLVLDDRNSLTLSKKENINPGS